MGMQISTLITGNNTLNTSQETARGGRRAPLPVEQNPDNTQAEAAVQSDQNSVTFDIQSIAPGLEQLNLSFDRRLQFTLNRDSSEVTVKVIDNETDTVIRVLPPEELQRFQSRFRETICFLFDGTV